MVKGAFKSMRHEHHFKANSGGTVMTDKFEYQVPFGFIGQIFDEMVLRNYMTGFLVTRNKMIKKIAEQK